MPRIGSGDLRRAAVPKALNTFAAPVTKKMAAALKTNDRAK
jgi:hypothetical protein